MDWWSAAAANNAQWCDTMCRCHGISTALRDGLWLAADRPPTLYPDVITLASATSTATVLDLLATRPECSVKDSYATLNLTPDGFVVLFAAEWIHHVASAERAPDPAWTVLRGVDELAEFSSAQGNLSGFPNELLSDPSIRVLACWDGPRVLAGAILSESQDVVGMSNVFANDGFECNPWAEVVAIAATLFPGMAVVGYECDNDLAMALAADFAVVGNLRVWIREPAPDVLSDGISPGAATSRAQESRSRLLVSTAAVST